MGIVRAQVSGAANLAAWLNTNATAFFNGVSQESGMQVWSATDKDGNKVFRFSADDFTAYRTNGANSIVADTGSMFNTTDIIMCDNGIILDTAYNYNISRKFGILITKTNNGKIACIFSYGGTETLDENYCYHLIQHVAIGDSTSLASTTTFTPESGQQTIMTTFATNADITQVSYTPKAFYMPMHSAYNQGIGKFLCGGKVYITNGYWCIDTETYEEDAT